jgi:hypothetical protein
MNARNKRRWSDLCGEAEVEEDLGKLQKLAEQITRILDAEQERLRNRRNQSRPIVKRAAKTPPYQSPPSTAACADVRGKAKDLRVLAEGQSSKEIAVALGLSFKTAETHHDVAVLDIAMRVCGSSMAPLIQDGFVVAVDSSDTDVSKLHGKVVIAWHKDRGLTISRFRRYNHTAILQSENTAYEAVILSARSSWKIVARVLWRIGKAP